MTNKSGAQLAANLADESSSSTIATTMTMESALFSAKNNVRESILKVKTQESSLAKKYKARKQAGDDASSVQFSSVEFRDYPYILGDNPSSVSGPPLSIDWKYQASAELPLDDYENARPPRRTKDNLVIPRSIREDWLRASGFSRGEMKAMEAQVELLQKSRLKHARQADAVFKLEETSERFQRKLRRWVTRGKSDKHLYHEFKANHQVGVAVA